MKSPSVVGGDAPMEIFPCLVTVMMLDWFRRRQQKRSTRFLLGLTFCHSYIVFHQWCLQGGCVVIYPYIVGYNSVSEVWCGISDFSFDGYVGGYGLLWIEDSCVRDHL